MNMLELNVYAEAKKKLDFRITLYYSAMTGIILFILLLFSGLVGAAFGFGIVSFLFLFGLVYTILHFQTNSVLKKLAKLDITEPYVVVTLMNEMGILILGQTEIKYQALLKMSNTKKLELPITEDLFIVYGDFKRKKRHDWKYGQYKKCHVTVREMPHGMVRQFAFYDLDGLMDRIGVRLNEINRFNAEKYQ